MESIAHIYIKYREKAFLFAKSYVRNKEIAEDIVEDAMVILLEKQDQLDSINNVQAMLFTIVKNKALDYLRHEMIKSSTHESIKESTLWDLNFVISCLESMTEKTILANEVNDIMNKTLDNLSPQTKKAFLMSKFERKPIKEIASKLGISVKGVDYHLSKAVKNLHVALKDYINIFI